MKDLTSDQMQVALVGLLDPKAKEVDMINFLTSLRDKPESAEEIKGAVLKLREMMVKLPIKEMEVLDTCGTGGDQKKSFNISTAVAFVVAGAGIAVAKHGNRAVSSRSGSADVLRALGINVDASPERVARSIEEIGIGFLFAPNFHPALKAVASARKKIGTKTIFNILGPLLNPANAAYQVIGVYSERLLGIVPQVLSELGSKRVAVVHGSDGMDELTLTGLSEIAWLRDGRIEREKFDPKMVGYEHCKPSELEGGSPEENAHRLRLCLKGHSEAIDHCVHLNAALAIQVSGRADNFKEALLMAQESISSGKAYQKLEELKSFYA